MPHGDILYAEQKDRRLYLCLFSGQRLCSPLLRLPFAQAAAPLLTDARFVRIHQSYLVNLAGVRRISRHELVLQNGDVLPLSRRHQAEFSAAYNAFCAHGSGVLSADGDAPPFADILAGLNVGVAVYAAAENARPTILYVNDRLAALLHVPRALFFSPGVNVLRAIHPADRARVVALLSHLGEEGPPYARLTFRCFTGLRQYRVMSAYVHVRFEGAQRLFYLAYLPDVPDAPGAVREAP